MAKAEERKAIIASRLREARRMAGLSQAQVAKMLGLHRPSITESEAGNRRVSADEIAQFAQLYDVSASWLLGEDTEQLDTQSDKVQLAARELQKLDPQDLDRLLVILSSMRREG
ncbi:MAG: helix-turn-helix transcriptional regulator [Cyanobacteria bacterium P01_D01_bin.56]